MNKVFNFISVLIFLSSLAKTKSFSLFCSSSYPYFGHWKNDIMEEFSCICNFFCRGFLGKTCSIKSKQTFFITCVITLSSICLFAEDFLLRDFGPAGLLEVAIRMTLGMMVMQTKISRTQRNLLRSCLYRSFKYYSYFI